MIVSPDVFTFIWLFDRFDVPFEVKGKRTICCFMIRFNFHKDADVLSDMPIKTTQ